MSVPLELALFIGGTFFSGLRSQIGRWMVTKTFELLHKLFIKSERDLAIWLHFRNKALAKGDRVSVNYEMPKREASDL